MLRKEKTAPKPTIHHPPNLVNILQPMIYLVIGLLIGLFMAKIIAKKSKDSNEAENHPKWHILDEILDTEIKLGNKFVISFIESDTLRTTLILKVYDERAHSRDMLFTATFYCVQYSSSKFKVLPGNYIVQPGKHESFHLAKFNWTDRGIVMVHRRS